MTRGVFRPAENKRIDATFADARLEIQPGDLLVSRANTTAYVGASVLVGACRPRLLLSDKSLRLVAREGVDRRWLQLMLSSPQVRDAISAKASGTKDSMRNISQAALLDLSMPKHSNGEQRRIVAILEDHLSRLDTADRYVHAAASSARTLRLRSLTGHLRSASTTEYVLGDLIEISIGGVWGADTGVEEVDVDVLRVTELRPLGGLDPSSAARRSVPCAHLQKRRLKLGDLLLEKSGGGPRQPVGRVGLVPALSRESICSNFMQLMRPDARKVLPRFLHLLLNDMHERGGTAHLQTASTNIRNIKASEYLKTRVEIPPLSEQAVLIERIEGDREVVAALEAAVRQTVRRGGVLRRALLSAAFSGGLTGRNSALDIAEAMVDEEHAEVPV